MRSASSESLCLHDWERHGASGHVEHDWERRTGIGEVDDDEVDPDSFLPEEAGAELFEELVALKFTGKLSARSCCVLAFWATRAGAEGKVAELAVKPSAQSGKFQQHLDSVLGVTKEDPSHYVVSIPGHDKFDTTRTAHEIPCVLPHEALNDELSEHPSLRERLAALVANNELPPLYFRHPTVRADPNTFPIAIYIDGVAFAKRDSLLGFWCYNLASGRRQLLVVLRKSALCKCGCLGHCSLHVVFGVLHWSFLHLARGSYPTRRHDGAPFGERDALRRVLAAKLMQLKGAVVQIKGDLVEHCTTLGLPTWQDNNHPCPYCWVTKADMFDVSRASPVLPWFPPKTHADYEAACARCEINVRVASAVAHSQIKAALYFDRRPGGGRGRCLLVDLPLLGLKRDDRLEPRPGMEDVAMFDTMHPPFDATFWRRSEETAVRRRIPLFSNATGITIQILYPDSLHCEFLGIYQQFGATVVHRLVAADAWGTRATTINARWDLSVLSMRSELFAWYRGLVLGKACARLRV